MSSFKEIRGVVIQPGTSFEDRIGNAEIALRLQHEKQLSSRPIGGLRYVDYEGRGWVAATFLSSTLGTGPGTIKKLLTEEKIPFVQLGRRKFFSEETAVPIVEAFVALPQVDKHGST